MPFKANSRTNDSRSFLGVVSVRAISDIDGISKFAQERDSDNNPFHLQLSHVFRRSSRSATKVISTVRKSDDGRRLSEEVSP